MKQLELWERMGGRLDANHPHYRIFRLQAMAQRVMGMFARSMGAAGLFLMGMPLTSTALCGPGCSPLTILVYGVPGVWLNLNVLFWLPTTTQLTKHLCCLRTTTHMPLISDTEGSLTSAELVSGLDGGVGGEWIYRCKMCR